MLRQLVLHMLLLLLVLLLLQNMKKFAQKARKPMLLFEELLMGSVQTLPAIAPKTTTPSNVLFHVRSPNAQRRISHILQTLVFSCDPRTSPGHTSNLLRYAPLSSHCLLLVDALHPLLIGTLRNRGARHLLGVKYRQSNSILEPMSLCLLYNWLKHRYTPAMMLSMWLLATQSLSVVLPL